MENNVVQAVGMITEDAILGFEDHGERFYKTKISVRRESGVVDELPVLFSERLLDEPKELFGRIVKIQGEYRSYNVECSQKENGKKLLLRIFAKELEVIEDEQEDMNAIMLDGYLCKTPVYRKTPLGREITNLLIAVNGKNNRSSYLPCIVWGRCARWAGRQKAGLHVKLKGRIQSREYTKAMGDGTKEIRIAYEVSINEIQTVED